MCVCAVHMEGQRRKNELIKFNVVFYAKKKKSQRMVRQDMANRLERIFVTSSVTAYLLDVDVLNIS